MNVIWLIIEISANFAEIAIIYYFVSKVLIKKYSNKIIVFVAVITGIIFSLINHFNISNANSISSIAIYFSIYLGMLFLFKGTVLKKTLILMSAFLIIMASDILVIVFLKFFLSISLVDIFGSNYYRFIGIVFSKIISILFVWNFFGNSIKHNYNIDRKYIFEITSILLLNLFIITILILTYKNNPSISKTLEGYLFLITAFLGLAFVFSFILINKIAEKTENEIRAMFQQEKNEMEKKYYENVIQMLHRISTLKHDLKNHLISISGLVEENNYEGIKKYLNTFLNNIDAKNIVLSNNSFIGAFVNNKIKSAEEKNINILTKIAINEDIKIEDYDLSIVLGNIFDNAIEAVEKVSENENQIDFKMEIKNKYLLIEVRNKIFEKIKKNKNEYDTTKQDKNEHGYGLKSVEKIVEKYHGNMEINEENNYFNVMILLLNEHM